MTFSVVEGTFETQGTVSGTDATTFALTDPQNIPAHVDSPNVLRVWMENPEQPDINVFNGDVTLEISTTNALLGVDGVTVISGVPTLAQDTISGSRTEWLAASGSLQSQIDTVEAGDVDDVNSVTGSVTIAGAGEVAVTTDGQTITVSGTPHETDTDTDTISDALVGVDGVTVLSGTPTAGETTISGFRDEFVAASGTLQSAIDSTQPDVDSLNALTGDITVIGKGEVGVTIEGQNIVVSGTDHATDTNTDTVSNALVGVDGITVISGVPTSSETTISGFRSELLVTATGSAGAGIIGFPTASGFATDLITTPPSPSVEGVMGFYNSAGWADGGTITDTGGGTVAVASGIGGIRTANASLAQLVAFGWPQTSGLAVPNDSTRFLGVSYDSTADTATVVNQTVNTWDYKTEFPLGTVFNRDNILTIINAPQTVGDAIALVNQRFQEVDGAVRADQLGGLIIGETGTRNVTMSEGTIWFKLNPFAIAAVDTSGSDDFDAFYRDGGGGFTKVASETQWDNDSWDDNSGVLATLTNNRYGTLWWYLDIDGTLVCIYGRGDHVKIGDAEAETIPNTRPQGLDNAVFLGRFIFLKNASTVSIIESAFDTLFALTGITDHGNLAGLLDDDHPLYPLVDGTRGFLGTVSGVDPIDSDDLATKNYVDTQDVTISGHLQSAIDAVEGSDVDSINALTGDVVVIGKGEVGVTIEGQNIVVSGTEHATDTDTDTISDAMVGTDGITVISGVPTSSETTISGFRGEFVSSSGSLQSQLDALDVVDSLNSETGDLTVVGAGEVAVTTAGSIITVSGTPHPSDTDTDTISDAILGGIGIVVTSGVDTITIDGHIRYTKDENDAILGTDGITVISGSNIITVSGFQTEFVSASGSLQTQIDAVEASDVDDVNAVTGSVTIAGAGEVVVTTDGQIITVSGTDHATDTDTISNALVGADGITVISGVPTSSETTVSGFQTEFVNASGSLQGQLDSLDVVDSLNSQTGDLTVVGAGEVAVTTDGTVITVSGTEHATDTDTDTVSNAIIGGIGIAVTSGIDTTTIDGHLRYTKDENDAILGVDGIAIISGTNIITVSGFQTEFVSASGSLQTQIDAVEGSDIDSITISGTQLTGDIVFEGLGSVNLDTSGQTVIFSGSGGGGSGAITDINGEVGSITIEGAGEVEVTTAGQTITISGTDHSAGGDSDSLVGAGGITVLSGVPTSAQVTISGFRDEFVSASGSLQTQIDAVDGGGSGEVSDALVGVDGITVLSGTPTESETTVSGFRTEFLNASGTLSSEIDSDIATHTAISDAHHARYTKDENDAIIGGSNVTVVSGVNIITISSTGGGGGGGTVSDAMVGADGITVISGVPTESETTISGFRTEFVAASGSLQTAIDVTTSGTFVFNQVAPATEWLIPHTLATKAITWTITDVNGLRFKEDTATISGSDNLRLSFNPARAGIAYVLAGGNVPGSLSGLREDENGFFFQTVVGSVTLMEKSSYARTIVDFTGVTVSGSVSGTVSIDGTEVDGISNQIWNTSQSTKTATGNNLIPIGGRALLTISGASSFERFGWTYATERP